MLAPEKSSLEAFEKNFERYFEIEGNGGLGARFLRALKERLCYELTNNDVFDETTTWRDEDLPPHVLAKRREGWTAFRLDVPDHGDGGSAIQAALRETLADVDFDDLYVERL